uniref:Uncharacterized protein n=1 Tax=Caenorhabditis japonica TaxID=281687 RepID=A0A8R1IJ34_CAEJA
MYCIKSKYYSSSKSLYCITARPNRCTLYCITSKYHSSSQSSITSKYYSSSKSSLFSIHGHEPGGTNVRKVSQESNAESVQSIPRPAEILVTSPTNEPAVPTPAPNPSRFPVTESASVPVVESNGSVVVPPVTSTASTHLANPSPVSHSFSSNSSPSATTHSNRRKKGKDEIPVDTLRCRRIKLI